MAGMYGDVSLLNLYRTATGNYPQEPSQRTNNPSPMNSGTTQSWNRPNDQNQRALSLAQSGSLPLAIGSEWAGRIVGGAMRDNYATEDYKAQHGGIGPASPEELRAWQSYNSTTPVPFEEPVQPNPAEERISGILGINSLSQEGLESESAQDKATKQIGALNSSLQEVKQRAADAASKGYTNVPSASQDPVGAAAAMNDNRARGVGGPTGTLNFSGPTPPTPTQQQNMQLDKVGKETAFDANSLGPWYKSQSFNYGLISFGLNLLSGNDLATSFGAAGQAFSSMYGQEQRSSWAEDLINQGYSRQEVEEYVRTGESKVLTDPMERQARNIQMQTNLQTLNNLQYDNSPEMRARQLDRENRKDSLEELRIRSSIANDNARLGIARQQLELREKAAQGAGENYYTDTDGRRWTVLKNARGTPLINTYGMATLYDPSTGETTWRNISENQRQMGGIQANEGLHAMDQFSSSGLLNYTGNSLVAQAKRKLQDQLGNNITSDLTSNIENLNGAMRAALETQLMQENNNRPVQKYMLDTAVKRLGKISIDNSPEENARIMANYRSTLNSQFNARGETHPTVENRNYTDPQRPGVTFDGSNANPQTGLYVGQVVNGRTYIGGNPNSRSSWR